MFGPPELIFVHAPGCHACEAARPEWEKFKQAAGAIGVLAAEHDLTLGFAPVGRARWEPSATPSYVLRIGYRAWVFEGTTPADVLVRWVEMKRHGA